MNKIIKNNLSKIFKENLNRLNLFRVTALCLILSPSITLAQANNPVSTVLLDCTKSDTPCGWTELISLINAMIKYGIELIAIAFVIVLIYTGFLYLTSGGDASKVKKSRDMLNKIMWGMIYTLCGWVIVYFIITSLGVTPDFYNKIISQ